MNYLTQKQFYLVQGDVVAKKVKGGWSLHRGEFTMKTDRVKSPRIFRLLCTVARVCGENGVKEFKVLSTS